MTEGRGKGEEREGAREGRSPPIHIPGYTTGLSIDGLVAWTGT